MAHKVKCIFSAKIQNETINVYCSKTVSAHYRLRTCCMRYSQPIHTWKYLASTYIKGTPKSFIVP